MSRIEKRVVEKIDERVVELIEVAREGAEMRKEEERMNEGMKEGKQKEVNAVGVEHIWHEAEWPCEHGGGEGGEKQNNEKCDLLTRELTDCRTEQKRDDMNKIQGLENKLLQLETYWQGGEA